MKQGSPISTVLSGDDLRRAFQAATGCLERQREAINSLNVFPVPDGDTGTNMLLTMRSVNETSSQASGASAATISAAMSQGALLGARGNSGVILSQFFHGLAQGLQQQDVCNGEDLARAFGRASKAAYDSVSKPVDGTMLTVIRELSLAASTRIGGETGSVDALSVWRVGLEAAKEALSRTPLQLPVLREAGVVDAGGQGIVTLLDGAWHYLAGENVDELELELCIPVGLDGSAAGTPAQPAVQQEYLAATEDELHGYCTQLLIHGQGLDVDSIRGELSTIAESTVVVGNESLVKVHVHIHDPGPVISYAVSQGAISQVSMDNIDQQHREFVALHRSQATVADIGPEEVSDALYSPGTPASPGALATAIVAVAWGDGFVRLLKGLGCAAVITGGQTMNPSTQELLKAAGEIGAREVILLPNNPNIIPAARQAASIADGQLDQTSVQPPVLASGVKLCVVPSRSIPQGVAALLAFNPEGTLDSNLGAMERALTTVKTVEVTRAVRPAAIGGLAVEEGHHIGLLEGELVASGDSAVSALQQTLIKGQPTRGQLTTLYWGGDMEEAGALEAAAQLRGSIPGMEVEVVYGGQPFYQFIASLE